MMNPGVQNQHCEPWKSTMACCTGCKVASGAATPSTGENAVPYRVGKNRIHALMGRKHGWPAASRLASTIVQAPQSPSAQPSLVPAQLGCSRRNCNTVVVGLGA